MCIAFDGAYILEAPAADPGITDEGRPDTANEHPLVPADHALANSAADGRPGLVSAAHK